MFTVDASVHLNAINAHEENSPESREFLEVLKRNRLPVYTPTLLLVELASSLARLFDNPSKGIELARLVRYLPEHTWIPLDHALADDASRIGAEQRLRGADAIYAVVAQRYQTVLVTLDRQQIDRLSPVLQVRRPEEALRELMAPGGLS